MDWTGLEQRWGSTREPRAARPSPAAGTWQLRVTHPALRSWCPRTCSAILCLAAQNCQGFPEHCTCCFCSSRAPTCVSYCFVLTQNWREQLQIPKTNEQRQTPDQRHIFTCPTEWPGCWEAAAPRAQELCLGRGLAAPGLLWTHSLCQS